MPTGTGKTEVALAAMARVHPFFERAGMTRYDAAPPAEGERLKEALATAGIGRRDVRSAKALVAAVERLADASLRRWVEQGIMRWMRSYLGAKTSKTVRTTLATACGAAARFLHSLPVYYLWADPDRATG